LSLLQRRAQQATAQVKHGVIEMLRFDFSEQVYYVPQEPVGMESSEGIE